MRRFSSRQGLRLTNGVGLRAKPALSPHRSSPNRRALSAIRNERTQHPKADTVAAGKQGPVSLVGGAPRSTWACMKRRVARPGCFAGLTLCVLMPTRFGGSHHGVQGLRRRRQSCGSRWVASAALLTANTSGLPSLQNRPRGCALTQTPSVSAHAPAVGQARTNLSQFVRPT